MISQNAKLYATKMGKLTPAQAEFVDSVYAMCEEHYEDGGDVIVECYEPAQIVERFQTLADVREMCGMRAEQALNAREGTDEDHELEYYERAQKWIKSAN